jgi:hypothetical protein
MADVEKKESKGSPVVDSNFYLKLSIKGVDVDTPLVLSMNIREWIFDVLPRIELEIYDNGRFTDQYPLEDNDEIKVELNNIETRDPIVKATFSLHDHEILNGETGKNTAVIIKITGILKSNDMLFPIRNRSFSGKSSKDVFQSIADECGHTFKSDISPKDTMTWLQVNQNNNNFISHVLERSYVYDDVSFCYVNRNNEMIHTSLKSRVKNKNEIKLYLFDMMPTTLNTAQTSKVEVDNKLQKEKEDLGKEKISFFMNWSYKNTAGTFNKKSSYGRAYSYYDFKKEFNGEYFKDDILLSKHSNKEKENIGKMTVDDDYGNFDEINTYTEYILAQTQNRFIKDDFFNSYLVLYSRPEPDLNLFDIVTVAIPSSFNAESPLNEVHSGEYIVGGIIHTIQRKALYNSVLILYRNGKNINGFLKENEIRHSKRG